MGNDAEHAFRRFIDAFNREDLDALDDAWTSPFAYTSNGEVKTFAKYRDFVNDRDGWKLRVGMNFANLPTGR